MYDKFYDWVSGSELAGGDYREIFETRQALPIYLRSLKQTFIWKNVYTKKISKFYQDFKSLIKSLIFNIFFWLV